MGEAPPESDEVSNEHCPKVHSVLYSSHTTAFKLGGLFAFRGGRKKWVLKQLFYGWLMENAYEVIFSEF